MTWTSKELLAQGKTIEAVQWRIARRRCGLKLNDVCQMLDLSKTTISAVELGKRPCSDVVRQQLTLLYSRWENVEREKVKLREQCRALREK